MTIDQDELVDRALRESGDQWRNSVSNDLRVDPAWFRRSARWSRPAMALLVAGAATAVLLIAVTIRLVLWSAPQTAPGTTAAPSALPSAVATEPITTCAGGVSPATCAEAARIAVSAVASSGWTPMRIWINSGLLCPDQGCLFDPNANFPYPIPPDGGQWVANAEIAFAESDKHAGMNIATDGSGLVPVLIGYRVPALAWCSGTCPSAVTTEGPFRLELVLPHLDWKPGDPITGTAILGFDGPASTTVWGSGGGPIAFSYAEVGGIRAVDPIWSADCAPHLLDPPTPISAGLSKSGAVSGDEPDADFVRSFLFGGPGVRLPAGSWDISAIANFHDGADCSGAAYTVMATVRISVTGELPSSPGPAHPEPNPRGAYVIELSSAGSAFTPITVGAEGAGCERLLADADANRICLIANNLNPLIIGAEAYGALNDAPSPAFHALVWRARADADPLVCGRGGLEGELLDRCLAEAQAADYTYAAGQIQIKVRIGGAAPRPDAID